MRGQSRCPQSGAGAPITPNKKVSVTRGPDDPRIAVPDMYAIPTLRRHRAHPTDTDTGMHVCAGGAGMVWACGGRHLLVSRGGIPDVEIRGMAFAVARALTGTQQIPNSTGYTFDSKAGIYEPVSFVCLNLYRLLCVPYLQLVASYGIALHPHR